MTDYATWLTNQADKQNQFNAQMTDKTNAFNAAEAQKNRDWQEEMSNTALTRKMADAEKAGLNPIFAVNAEGASTPSGATAKGDSPKEATDIINAMTSYTNTMEQIRSQKEIAEKQMQAQLQAAQIAANATIAAANAAAAASRYAADQNSAANRYASDRNYQASIYKTDKSYEQSVLTQGVSPSGALWLNQPLNALINGGINQGVNALQNGSLFDWIGNTFVKGVKKVFG